MFSIFVLTFYNLAKVSIIFEKQKNIITFVLQFLQT